MANQLLAFFKKEEWLSIYASNHNPDPASEFDLIAAVGTHRHFIAGESPVLEQLRDVADGNKDWLFGYISYDVKNEIENLGSQHANPAGFPLLVFYQPRYIFKLKNNRLEIGWLKELHTVEEVKSMMEKLLAADRIIPGEEAGEALHKVKSRLTKQEYIDAVEKIKSHIHAGDIYEMNYCMEFFSEQARLDPYAVYQRLNALSEAPFSAFCRYGQRFILSSSPERFIKRSGKKLISQPMKGTIKRGREEAEDHVFQDQLRQSKKEQNENVMIVDIVRNDLSRLADRGSVKVSELFGVRTYKQVHQMISTIETTMKEPVSFTDIVRATFPMGSMTGAPKIKAMQLIDRYEKSSRGVYSGALGYIAPGGDFDFSVVIRSILYDHMREYISFSTGSAITDMCEPEKEYEECLLKASALLKAIPAEL